MAKQYPRIDKHFSSGYHTIENYDRFHKELADIVNESLEVQRDELMLDQSLSNSSKHQKLTHLRHLASRWKKVNRRVGLAFAIDP